MKTLTIQSCPEQIGHLEPYLREVFDFYDLEEKSFPEVLISLTEAVSNAVIHGNDLERKKCVQVSASIQNRHLRITIQDEGKGFDPNKVRNPLKSSRLEQEGGRGLLLMKKLCRQVTFHENGSLVVLIFNVSAK